MVSIKKKEISNNTYYYLQHTYRKDGTVCYEEKYLGKKIPKDIDTIKQQFLREIYQELWYKKFDTIKNNFQKDHKKHLHRFKRKNLISLPSHSRMQQIKSKDQHLPEEKLHCF